MRPCKHFQNNHTNVVSCIQICGAIICPPQTLAESDLLPTSRAGTSLAGRTSHVLTGPGRSLGADRHCWKRSI